MAAPVWAMINPKNGIGSGTVVVSANPHTGRVQRTGTITFRTHDGSTTVNRTVNQSPKSEFVEIGDGVSQLAGGTVQLNGTSNSSTLTFSLGGGADFVIQLPANYAAVGGQPVNTPNGQPIGGDPGAVKEYNFSIVVTVPAGNEGDEATVVVTTAGNQTATATIELTANILSVSPSEINLNQNGDPVNVTVTTSEEWNVS